MVVQFKPLHTDNQLLKLKTNTLITLTFKNVVIKDIWKLIETKQSSFADKENCLKTRIQISKQSLTSIINKT